MEETGKQENTQDLIDIFEICSRIWKTFRRIWWLILLFICIGIGISVFQEKSGYREQYEASASFIVSAGGSESLASYYNRVTMEQVNSTFPYILTSGILNQIVATDLGMESVPGSISASVLEETNLFQIRVVSSDAQQSYDILQSVIKNYPTVAKYVIGDTTLKLIDESGVPTAPIAEPGYKRAVLKGAITGGFAGCLILLLCVAFRNTVRSQEDIKKFLNVKYLAGIPKEQMRKRSRNGYGGVMMDKNQVSYVFREALSTLQIRLNRIMKEKDIKTVMITSTLAEEGKTTVACNLAYTMASKGYKVLLIDADFRNPSVASVLQLQTKEKGIEDVLAGNAEPEEALCCYEDSGLWVLPGVKSRDKVAKLYKNGNFRSLIETYKEKMDIILIDTPPCGVMNDAVLAADYVDGVMLVIRQDYAKRNKILEGVEVFSDSHAQLVGCVINGEETGIGSYGYGKYGYGRYGYGRYGYGAKKD